MAYLLFIYMNLCEFYVHTDIGARLCLSSGHEVINRNNTPDSPETDCLFFSLKGVCIPHHLTS